MDIAYIRTANTVRGMHFFDRDTLRFFNSRILSDVYEGTGGIYFATSEKGPDGVRRYTVRRFEKATGSVGTFGTFQAYRTARAAKGAAKRAAEATREDAPERVPAPPPGGCCNS